MNFSTKQPIDLYDISDPGKPILFAWQWGRVLMAINISFASNTASSTQESRFNSQSLWNMQLKQSVYLQWWIGTSTSTHHQRYPLPTTQASLSL
jgi:hypothetical protein